MLSHWVYTAKLCANCKDCMQVSRVAQAEVLLRESSTWVEEAKLDEVITTALDNPTDLFLGGEPWHDSLVGVPEYVEGFEGPQVRCNFSLLVFCIRFPSSPAPVRMLLLQEEVCFRTVHLRHSLVV